MELNESHWIYIFGIWLVVTILLAVLALGTLSDKFYIGTWVCIFAMIGIWWIGTHFMDKAKSVKQNNS